VEHLNYRYLVSFIFFVIVNCARLFLAQKTPEKKKVVLKDKGDDDSDDEDDEKSKRFILIRWLFHRKNSSRSTNIKYR
jgi:hypothetical protein